jgi:hypothetical protein
MKQWFHGRLTRIWIGPLITLILLAIGCSPPPTADPTTALPATSEPVASPAPTQTPDASLTAVEIIVKRFREGNSVVALEKDDSVDIRVNDQISVEEKGKGLLRFQDNLLVEILHGTELDIENVRLEPGESIFVRLQQLLGTTRTELKNAANARISYGTEFATITSVGDPAGDAEGDTEFVICHAPGKVTCMVTLAGEMEVEAYGEVVNVEAGEATYIFPGEPPGPAICADIDEVQIWLDMYRNAEKVEPLGKIVGTWPQDPCEDGVPVPILPPADGMAKIEAGVYTVGISETDDYHASPMRISTSGFWVDQYEVTNAQYQGFLSDTGHSAPAAWTDRSLPSGQEAHPVKGVRWDEAAAYCEWANKRLPSESEWEIAARGPGSQPALYPWGADPWAEGQADNLPLSGTYEVGAMPFNKSAFEVYDLAGNVWEWVGEPYASVADGSKILRGGRHGLLKDMAYRQPAEPDIERFIPFAGFRCAADHVLGE